MNSGIGNAKTLTLLGVKSIIDLPDVGQNLSDHASLEIHGLLMLMEPIPLR